VWGRSNGRPNRQQSLEMLHSRELKESKLKPPEEDQSNSLTLLGQSKKELLLATATKRIEDSAHSLGVELDIPVARVAAMVIRYRLNEVQIEDFMLARQQYETPFSVVEHLLAVGYSSDQIFAAYHIASGLGTNEATGRDSDAHTASDKPGADDVAIIEEPKSLFDVGEALTPEDKGHPGESTVVPQGASLDEILPHIYDKFIAMLCEWLVTLDVFNDISDLDEVASIFEMLVEEAVSQNFIKGSRSSLVVLTMLLVECKNNADKAFDTNTYDGLMRLIKSRSGEIYQ